MQFTIVWGMNDLFGVKGLVFSGFADFWWEDIIWDASNPLDVDKTHCVFLTEPQIWYNVGQFFNCPNLFLGGEVELAYNFAGAWRLNHTDNKGFNVSPCLGLKWNF